jgi:hypothetical protein
LRGGSWHYSPGDLRSAHRGGKPTGVKYVDVGFRVARTLTAQPAASPVKNTHWSKSEYHNPGLTGRVTFNYSNNNGGYSIGRDEFFFETQWSKASDRSIHLYSDPPSIVGIAQAPDFPDLWDFASYDLSELAKYDMSSRVRTIQEGEHAILENRHNKYAVLKVVDIKDRTRSDTVDELTFDFWIRTDTTKAEHRDDRGKRRAGSEIRERAEEAEAKRGAEEEALRQAEQAAEPQKTEKPLKPSSVFRDIDAPWCPELVVIPPGEFMMGSTEAECEWAIEQGAAREWVEWEKPQHRVRIAYPLAVGQYPVTFGGVWPFCPHHRGGAARRRRLGPRP